SMMVALKVMTYFKVSLSTHNWDRAFFYAIGICHRYKGVRLRGDHLPDASSVHICTMYRHPVYI
ncbi:hypothetical protein NUK47_21400, partial [Aeromonas hydrophila]|uniref:hypothetical protein n=1 Tax=Aeromonas hydrophila TaxID=644 RepID=UPI00214D1FE0